MITFEPSVRLDVLTLTVVITLWLIRYEVRQAVLEERLKRIWYKVFGESLNREG